MRVFLIGFMASGKSTVGRRLALRLGWPFVDSDEQVERRTGGSINELFAAAGEHSFRRIERAVLASLIENSGPNLVLATGGGCVEDAVNRSLLTGRGCAFWLDLPWEETRVRLSGDSSRPLAVDLAKCRRRFLSRRPLYASIGRRIPITQGTDPSRLAALVHREVFAASGSVLTG